MKLMDKKEQRTANKVLPKVGLEERKGQVLQYNKSIVFLKKEQGTVLCSYLLSLKPFIYKGFRPPSGMP